MNDANVNLDIIPYLNLYIEPSIIQLRIIPANSKIFGGSYSTEICCVILVFLTLEEVGMTYSYYWSVAIYGGNMPNSKLQH